MGCGGPGQGACNVEFAIDQETQDAQDGAFVAASQANSSLKGVMSGIDAGKFAWSFIPQIPTAACVNPTMVSPIGDARITMDICGGFNRFSFFLNAVLALFCAYGCVRQVREAIAA